MDRRVVVTGVGVVAPNGVGKDEFQAALKVGQSGIRFIEKLRELNFRCQVGGAPQGATEKAKTYFSQEDLFAMNEAMTYGCMAAVDAWKDAGLSVPDRSGSTVNWDCGCVLGSGLSGIDTVATALVPNINAGKVKRLGGTIVEQTMASSVSAKLSGVLALGNQVTTNSSACNTGTEAINDGFHRIKAGLADAMLVGGTEAASPYIWGGFDAMRVLNSNHNESPELASRPMSESADGFIPGSGAGVLMIETLDRAKSRGARIYCEILSAAVNCGGHRNGGSMTAPNSESVQRCIKAAVAQAGISPDEIDAINGHLTATMADPLEVKNWAAALGRSPDSFPFIQSTKSMIGHCLGAAGSIEAVAVVLQLAGGFLHPSINCEDVHHDLTPFSRSIVHKPLERDIKTIAKASFGFGDVNGCLVFRKWN
jgi:3-oxoacyl-(acyl-carrier-protein) synthase